MSLDQTVVPNGGIVQPAPQPHITQQPVAVPSAGNPLSKFFRQPAIYMSLPSGGAYWPEGTLDMPPTGELPVYPLTSRDEITLRTPDALLNGQGVVDVIQSCVPNIKNAWKMPSTDVDSLLLAIRIASYGHSMDFENKCPHCEEEHTYSMDLRQLAGAIKFPDYDNPAKTHGITVTFRPSNYEEITELNKINYELTRSNETVRESTDEELQRSVMQNTLNRVIELGQDVMARSTASILDDSTGTLITEQEYIREFYKSIDAKLYNALQDSLTATSKEANIKPIPVDCQGCGGPISLTILFDYSSFFVVGS
jgi:hypothetical protein